MDLRNLQSQLTSTGRVQPRRAATPTRTYLSIADCTTLTLGNAMAMWAFEHNDKSTLTAPTASSLGTALSEALSAFPHFAGRLEVNPWPSEGPDKVSHEKRFRRALVSYGNPSDPGVDVQTAILNAPMSAIFPDASTRAQKNWEWDLSDTNLVVLFSPEGETAGSLKGERPDTPVVRIRITEFACKNLAIAIKISHPIADAETMIAFMKTWAEEHRVRMMNEYPPVPVPVFDPSILDSRADGDIDGPTADSSIVAESQALPIPWFDWWEHDPGDSAWTSSDPQATVPSEIPQSYADARRRGNRIPWEEWNTAAPVSHYIIRLSSEEIDTLWFASRLNWKMEGVPISRHDSIVAFIWQLTCLAKPPSEWPVKPGEGEEVTVSLDTTIGLRSRLSLPKRFVGSPILQVGFSRPYHQVIGKSAVTYDGEDATRTPVIDEDALGGTSGALHMHIDSFHRSNLAAWLHEMAFDPAPHRWWHGFLGSRHLMATSWVRAGLWEVDFGFDWKPPPVDDDFPLRVDTSGIRWAGVIGPKLDGLVTLTEGVGSQKFEWSAGGVDIDIKLERLAMERFRSLLAQWRAQQAAT